MIVMIMMMANALLAVASESMEGHSQWKGLVNGRAQAWDDAKHRQWQDSRNITNPATNPMRSNFTCVLGGLGDRML
ncbi:hypothetical protein V8C86DRAFT_2971181, partial [Haematococcus lacustris]